MISVSLRISDVSLLPNAEFPPNQRSDCVQSLLYVCESSEILLLRELPEKIVEEVFRRSAAPQNSNEKVVLPRLEFQCQLRS